MGSLNPGPVFRVGVGSNPEQGWLSLARKFSVAAEIRIVKSAI